MRIGQREVAVRNKALVLLRAAPNTNIVTESVRLASTLLAHMPCRTKNVNVMARLKRDPFALVSKASGFDATIELGADAEFAAFAEALGPLDLSPFDSRSAVVLVGRDLVFRPCPPQELRFQYLMARRPDLSHEDYARHYAQVHSEFGFKTVGVRGYAQFHVDPEASSRLGPCRFDGVSQLSMAGLTGFVLSSPLNGARGMVKDEKRFVDRANSAMFTSRVVARLE